MSINGQNSITQHTENRERHQANHIPLYARDQIRPDVLHRSGLLPNQVSSNKEFYTLLTLDKLLKYKYPTTRKTIAPKNYDFRNS